ncbi:MAG TPA: LacI family DNA-binding transcriptional regulator [Spirochaetia bacterium]|nr:LacI family DNA-binding transcriptional regulator [Spirochaetia bacterium]
MARLAKVSVGTVSRYLNGFVLREKNRARVEAAISELRYKVNFIAKGMKTRRTLSIGLLVTKLDEFHATIVRRLERVLSKQGYMLVVCDYEHDIATLESKLTFLMDRSIDGFIVSPVPRHIKVLSELRDAGVPVVFFNNSVPGFETDHIASDGASAVYRAVDHLVHLGHSRIALVSGRRSYSTAADRFSGYRDALKDNNIPVVSGLLREVDWAVPLEGYRAAKSVLSSDPPPSAILAGNYIVGLGVLRAIRELDIKMPARLSFVTFDDGEVFQLNSPSITAITQPLDDLAEATAAILLRRLSGDWEDFPADVLLPAQLVLRDSIAAPYRP